MIKILQLQEFRQVIVNKSVYQGFITQGKYKILNYIFINLQQTVSN